MDPTRGGGGEDQLIETVPEGVPYINLLEKYFKSAKESKKSCLTTISHKISNINQEADFYKLKNQTEILE